ncbi:glycosyltransferase [Puniceicoccus vermicola]|uniref:Glycosyltransferase n=1 Tax=Puniceicoccus vermicola TaxID=388746 RepID=A0A7X1AWJ1_9BACT|nr:glycosyltransferase [Puniceicoccus vermicola]MBC2601104.1 glycosyltransferase [Puniceicoccus vermicola]
MTRWLFIGSVYPPSWEERFGVGSSPTIDVQRSLLAGMSRKGWKPDAILTTPPVRLFPRDRFQWFPRELGGTIEGYPETPLVSLGINNLEPFKTVGIAGQLKRYLSSWCRMVRGEGATPKVFVYNLGPTHEQGGFLAGICRSLQLPMYPFITDLDFLDRGSFSPSTWRFRWQVRLLKAADKIAALNPNVLTEFGSGKPTLHVPGIAPDGPFFRELLDCPLPDASSELPTFLYSGSLNRPRGIIRLLNAYEQVGPERFRLRITGRGPEEERVREASARHKNIEYLGFLKTERERLEAMASADVLLNPHEIDTPEARYLFPSKLAEYMASGRLVVSSLLPGMAAFPLEEMILAKEDSDEAFAAAMARALEMTVEERNQKALRTREWARNHFDWDQIAGNLVDFLERDVPIQGAPGKISD